MFTQLAISLWDQKFSSGANKNRVKEPNLTKNQAMSLIEECCMGFHMRRLVSESPYGGKDDLFNSEGFVNAAKLEMFLL